MWLYKFNVYDKNDNFICHYQCVAESLSKAYVFANDDFGYWYGARDLTFILKDTIML